MFHSSLPPLGTIYIAFGSFTTWEHAPKHVYDAIFEAIDELTDYRIIFSAKGATAKVGKHVRMLSWAPQMDILAHPKTKVFFTHGGLKSLKEAICANTPVSFMPLFAEQARNAKLAAADGLGTVLNKYVVTKQKVIDALLEVLENPSYADRMNRLHSQFLDRPMPHLDEATFLTNRVLRKNGKDVYFPIKGQDLTWSSYLYLD
ncbi:Protein UGT-64, partial [Aphelenchoides avenae]